MEKANITRVAREAGVSKTTISNYLNKKPGKISEDTRRRIEDVVLKLNYIPNFGARQIINKNRPKTIGIILEDASARSMFTDYFYGRLHAGISAAFLSRDYRIMMLPSLFNNAEENAEYLKDLSRGFVDGYMLFNIHEQDQYVEIFNKYKIPFICIGNMKNKNIRNYVGSDYVRAVKKAAEHFFAHGIHNIVVSAGYTDSIVGRQIVTGYRQAFEKRKLPVPAKNIITQKETASESIYRECLELLKGDGRPGAFILSEYQYHDLVKAAAELNLKLFGDIKVIVMNYFPPVPDPRITCFNVQCYKVGKTAADNLIGLMNGKMTEPCLFSMTYVQGNSCGCGEHKRR
ncbi:MAG: LacI family transcriptional regulator [Treponema sp.]|jgi:DNA-binding LacI/PurR family transcriptional regulator|nr:LacI family transcriptional regulator [Treponema sp.]